MNQDEKILEEEKKIRHLQFMVDLTIQELALSNSVKFIEGIIILNNLRKFTKNLFPDKVDVFNLIYKPRILRVLRTEELMKFSVN